MSTSPANPYQSPGAALAYARAEPRGAEGFLGHAAFAVVFGGNLIVPLMIALPSVREHGALGLVLALVLAFACGMCLCSLWPRLTGAFNLGGIVVGAFQLLPVLQAVAWFTGLEVADTLGLAGRGPGGLCGRGSNTPTIISNLCGFVVTAVCVALLLGMSEVAGLVLLRLWTWGRSRRTPTPRGLA